MVAAPGRHRLLLCGLQKLRGEMPPGVPRRDRQHGGGRQERNGGTGPAASTGQNVPHERAASRKRLRARGQTPRRLDGGLAVEPCKGQEYLYYVGCEGAYDSRAQHAARALATLLIEAGVSFGVLGSDETADGNDVELLGEEGLTEFLAEKNIRRFSQGGVKKIVTLSPHAYNAFKNIYPRFGARFEVFHYTQLLAGLIARGKLQPAPREGAAITFHDPCFLGRWNNEYNAPRKILKSIPGARIVEMGRNRKSALCCGGGAGNHVIDLLGGSEESPARLRVREACAAGANVLAVACPNCLTMLEDAVKVEGMEEHLRVRDISELLNKTE
jgi:Fe-S oxidoreductase